MRCCAQKIEKALMAELQGLQRMHVMIANQLTRLKVGNPPGHLWMTLFQT